MSETKRAKLPLRVKLGSLATVLAIVPTSAVGLGLIGINEDTLGTTSRDYRLAVAEDAANTLSQTLDDGESGVLSVAAALTRQELDTADRVTAALALVEANETLDHASIFGVDGQLVDVVAERGLDRSVAPSTLAGPDRAAAAKPGVHIGTVVALDQPRVLMVTAILGGGDEVRGYVAAHVRLTAVQERVAFLATHRFGGDYTGVVVVDDQLRVIAHPDPTIARQLTSLEGNPALQGVGSTAMAQKVALSGEFSNGDRLMVGSVVPSNRVPWYVVTQVPADVAYASIATMRRWVLIGTLLAVVIALVLALILTQRLTAPIRRLVEFAEALAARRFDERLVIRTSDELSILGQAMSRAASDLAESEVRLREEAAIRNDLGRYLPRELVDRVVSRQQDMGLGGQRRPITVLFADVVGFTPLTNELEPETVVTVLNELFTLLTEIVFRHGGTVDKFIGDCVMAFWGAPEAVDDHAARAVAAAEDMIRFLEVGNAGWKDKYGVTIELAVGVNTGEAVVGNIGSESRMEYTVIGDVVNVAARLEAIARPQQVLVTASTVDAAGTGFTFSEFGAREVSGRIGDITVFEVLV